MGKSKGNAGIQIKRIPEKRDRTRERYVQNWYINLWSNYIINMENTGYLYSAPYSLFKLIRYFKKMLSIVNQDLQVVNTKFKLFKAL